MTTAKPKSDLPPQIAAWFKKGNAGYVEGLSFDKYAKVLGLNASLLKQPTAAHMRHELMRQQSLALVHFGILRLEVNP